MIERTRKLRRCGAKLDPIVAAVTHDAVAEVEIVAIAGDEIDDVLLAFFVHDVWFCQARHET